MYDYRKAIKTDVQEWIADNETEVEGLDRQTCFEFVYDSCWISDSVTGNASGSYTMSRWEARQNFFEDVDSDDYVAEMIEDGFLTREELGGKISESNWEWLDVSIRCWLLNQIVTEVMDEMFED